MSNGRTPGPRSPLQKLEEQISRAEQAVDRATARLAAAEAELARLLELVDSTSSEISGPPPTSAAVAHPVAGAPTTTDTVEGD